MRWFRSPSSFAFRSDHEDGHRLPASECDRVVVDAHGDRVASEWSLVKDLDFGTLDKSQFEQAPLELHCAQAVRAILNMDGMDVATEPLPRQPQWHAFFRFYRRDAVGHAQVQNKAHGVNSTGPITDLGQDKQLGMSVS